MRAVGKQRVPCVILASDTDRGDEGAAGPPGAPLRLPVRDRNCQLEVIECRAVRLKQVERERYGPANSAVVGFHLRPHLEKGRHRTQPPVIGELDGGRYVGAQAAVIEHLQRDLGDDDGPAPSMDGGVDGP
jgi:hypothetical protein